ncbi:MAG: hypothetical protein FJ276_23355, partial [Planctomycetes bacterium]|nr:hypothetical protein [Planctomycetota bacterium]
QRTPAASACGGRSRPTLPPRRPHANATPCRHGVSRYRETMVHGFHVIFGAYGFWLPTDP